jgi:hypothetical protein
MAQSFIATVVGLLGLHMLGAAFRRRALAEAWIGAFFVASAIGAETAMRAIGSTDLALAPRWLSVGVCALTVATASGYAFTYTVFRRGEPWARAIVLAGTLLAVWGARCQLSGASGTPDVTGLRVEFLVGRIACFCWGTYEAMHAYAMARRRLALGMADPIVVNRFLLFGLWFGAMGIMPLTLAVTRILGGAPAQAAANGVGPKLVGCLMVVALMLTFFPPRGYQQWVTRSARMVLS